MTGPPGASIEQRMTGVPEGTAATATAPRGSSFPPHDDHLGALVRVLDAIRLQRARTRPELGRQLDLGRTVVTQRVSQLLARRLLDEGTPAPSTGGRPARQLRFRADAARPAPEPPRGRPRRRFPTCGCRAASRSGRFLRPTARWRRHRRPGGVRLFDELLSTRVFGTPTLWGIGVGLPGPVEFAVGRPITPPIMPGWDRYPVRDRLAARYGVPVWVDNDVNLMALGELRAGCARDHTDMIFIKVGTGIGAGLISGGRLHRGAQGVAGDVGHVAVVDDATVVCRCGNVGCLEAVAGGAALAGAAANMAAAGDPAVRSLLTESGRRVGQMLATLVNFYNPSLIVIGGGLADAGESYLDTIRQVVFARSLPLATHDLRIVRTALRGTVGLRGAAAVVIDELFSRGRIGRWIGHGSPAGRPEVAHSS
jgi:predicted NBD/HSP70 family sugar kinase